MTRQPTRNGKFLIRNDFQHGRYKVIVAVTEATTTRRDKTVKSSLKTAEVAMVAQDVELAQAAVITAVMNQDGEGMDELQKFARKRGLAIGLVEPNEQEAAAMKQAEEGAPPDPMQVLADAQAQALKGQGAKNMAEAAKLVADTRLSRAKATSTLADAAQTRTETLAMGGIPTVPPEPEAEAPPPGPPIGPEGPPEGPPAMEPPAEELPPGPPTQTIRRGSELGPPPGP